MKTGSVILKPGREKAVLRRHPWIFSGSVHSVRGDPLPGQTVEIESADGQWLARGAYSPASQIRVRIWTWEPDESINFNFFEHRVGKAISARRHLHEAPGVNGFREVFAESDGLPGFIVDRYGEYQVVQFLTAGGEFWRDELLRTLSVCSPARGVYERSDADVRALEGMEKRSGHLQGDRVPEPFYLEENGLKLRIDIKTGQKTGFFLDQRLHRSLIAEHVRDRDVLDGFCYSGGFGINALRGGASRVTFLDSSQDALELARYNVDLNGLGIERCDFVRADAFQYLRLMRDRSEAVDTIILDPPKFAPTSATADRASRGYKDINLMSFRVLGKGGTLFTFSCSGGISPQLFQQIVAGAALDAGVDVQVMTWFGQPDDHPVLLSFPESRYLKGLLCRLT